MEKVKISVIVPTYKPQFYLWECLDSLYYQTLDKKYYEVILVLNGCNEPYNTQIKSWISKHPDLILKYNQTEKGGVSNARNIALDMVNGDYITFLDDDDYFSNNTLLRLYEKANPRDVIIFKPLAFKDGTNDYFEYSRTYEFNRNCNKGILPFYKVRRNFGGPVMKLFPKDIIGNKRYNLSFKNGEDSIFMFLISDKMKNVQFAKEDAIYYRRVRTNSATTVSKSFEEVFFNSMRAIAEYSSIYFSNIGKYSFCFYVTRIMGGIRAVLNYKNITI